MNTRTTSATSSPSISSERVEGTTVYNPAGDKLGSICDLMIDKLSGRVRFAVLEFGGFMGMGTDRYPLPWAMLQYDTGRSGYVVPLEKSQLASAPRYAEDQRPDYTPAYGLEITQFWGGTSGAASVSAETRQRCIEACEACARACNHCTQACLEESDVDALRDCIALDIDCAAICTLTAGVVARFSECSPAVCHACAEVCRACGEECGRHADMGHCEACARACDACAEACLRLAEQAA